MYADYLREKEKWDEERRASDEEKASMELSREHDKIRLLEFEVYVKIIILLFPSLWKCEDGFLLNRATGLNFKEFKM